MQFKKTLLILLLSSSILGIFGCINCGEILDFKRIIDLNAYVYSTDYTKMDSDTISEDSLIIHLSFDTEYIAQQTNNPFINSSFGWSCPSSGTEGLKDTIVDFQIFSTYEYLDTPAGSDLNLRSRYTNKDNIIQEWNKYAYQYAYYLDEKKHGPFDLHLHLEYESGILDTFNIIQFVWE